MFFWHKSQALEVQVECYVIWHFRIQRILRKYLFHLQCHECVTTKVCPKNATETKKQHQPMQKCISRTFTQESMYDDSKSIKKTPCLIFACFSTWNDSPRKNASETPKKPQRQKTRKHPKCYAFIISPHLSCVCKPSEKEKICWNIWPNLKYFTNLDFPEIREFPFPSYLLGWGRAFFQLLWISCWLRLSLLAAPGIRRKQYKTTQLSACPHMFQRKGMLTRINLTQVANK